MKNIDNAAVADHYKSGQLLNSVRKGVNSLGKTIGSVTIDDLAPVDEFHVGGRKATKALLDQISLSADELVLDVGCGLGGTSRYIATTYDCVVRGIDLTAEYVQVGNEICNWLKLGDVVRLQQGDALHSGFDDGSFDAACMLHVGMNIADKEGLFSEIARVLQKGGQLAIYDIMTTNDEPFVYPVPWATASDTCAVASLHNYRDALMAAGFEIVKTRDRTEIAIDFFTKLKNNAVAADGPPPVGLHLLMGDATAVKVANMIANITSGRAAPTEIIARKV